VCSDGFFVLLLACFDGVCIQWLLRYGKVTEWYLFCGKV
jgi:hypothetical protein